LLQLLVLLTQFHYLAAGRLAYGVPLKALLASFQEVFAPAVIEIGDNPFPSAQFGDADLAP
jgi:hypothetical protein